MLHSFYNFYRMVSIDGIVIFAFLSATLYLLFQPKSDRISIRSYILLGSVTYIILYTMVLLLISRGSIQTTGSNSPYWYYFVCVVGISFFYSSRFLSGPMTLKLLYILFYTASIQLYKEVCSPLYVNEFSMNPTLYAALDLLSAFLLYLLLFLLTLLFRKFHLKNLFRMNRLQECLVFYIPISLLLGCMFSVILNSPLISVSILCGIVLSILPVIYYMLATLTANYDEQLRLTQALTASHAELAKIRESAELSERLRAERHEIKNNYFYLQALAKEGKFEELNQRLAAMTGQISDNLRTVDTGNLILDYLLTQKIETAKESKIPVVAEIALPKEITVDDQSLCTILSNLLDNAIEAERQTPDPEIRIVIKAIGNYFVIKISNHVNPEVIKQNPDLHSTKANAKNHGYGLKIIKKTVAEHNGIFRTYVEDSMFVAEVMI